jgi:hypothetical protein
MAEETRDFTQLPRTAIAQGTDILAIQAEDGPVQGIELARLIGRLGPVDVVKQTKALLDADLAWDPGKLAIVWGDADPDFLGYYVKTGASGAGAWVYSDVFRGFSAYHLAVANGFVGDVAAWLLSLHGADGDDGAPGAAGSKYRFGGSVEGNAAPSAADVLMRHVFQHAVNFPDDFAGSVARRAPGSAAPGANQVCPIKVNNVAVGSLTVLAAGGLTFVTTAGALACAIGDEFRLEAPAAAPAAELLGVTWTFAGTEAP